MFLIFLEEKNSITEDAPAILIVGESNPSHLERKLGIAAMKLNKTRKRKIVVVEIQDLWGGAIRLSGVKPDHILTLDTYAKKLALKTHRYLSQNDVTIVGNPSVQKITVSRRVRHLYNHLKKRFDCLYYYAGGGVSTGAELKLLMNCLTRTSGNWGLIVGFHPNINTSTLELKHEDLKKFYDSLKAEKYILELPII